MQALWARGSGPESRPLTLSLSDHLCLLQAFAGRARFLSGQAVLDVTDRLSGERPTPHGLPAKPLFFSHGRQTVS